MRILFDHNVPKKLRRFLIPHEVLTAAEMGWSRIENGDLLKIAELDGFDLFLTCDQNISYQQNLKGRRLSLVVLTTNYWPQIKVSTERVVAAVEATYEGSFQTIDFDD